MSSIPYEPKHSKITRQIIREKYLHCEVYKMTSSIHISYMENCAKQVSLLKVDYILKVMY